jgi:DNA-binding IclR family transcriptional regulator
MDSVSGVGVLDKAFVVLNALVARPLSLSESVEATGIPRATCHRLLSALEHHRAREIATEIRDRTGESVQVFIAETDGRRCVISLESPNGLRWIVPEGSLFPLARGSAGKVLSAKTAPASWVESVEERVKGVASVSAPILDVDGHVIAAISISGPLERMSRTPGAKFGTVVVRGAKTLSQFFQS